MCINAVGVYMLCVYPPPAFFGWWVEEHAGRKAAEACTHKTALVTPPGVANVTTALPSETSTLLICPQKEKKSSMDLAWVPGDKPVTMAVRDMLGEGACTTDSVSGKRTNGRQTAEGDR